MRLGKSVALAAALCLTTASLVTPAASQSSMRRKQEEKKAEIPTCSQRIGTLAVREPTNRWWEGLGLESPEALLKIFVQRSGCFTLVDRGKGFEMAQQERALASGGALQGGSNIGGGQVRAADYILVPDIVSKNSNAGGTNVGGLLGGFMGGFAGAIVSGISINSKSADVILSVTNVRTSEQQAMAEGHGDKTDVGFSLGGGGFGGGVFGGAGVSSYQNSAIGQVVVLAYIDAYTKLVGQMGGLSTNAKADAPERTVTMTRPGVMRATPSEKGKVVRQLDPGMILYPTGNTDGVWREVTDEVDNKGWVPNGSLAMAR
ncbi:MAG TPA: CsgG/HfaB family protein [Rhizomicrobium sp.]|jgi:curli biogenesis system outer membrane secretion channel CsgG|nr:CsgG/HfaB family protein [Rhizomicrobium sp.]